MSLSAFVACYGIGRDVVIAHKLDYDVADMIVASLCYHQDWNFRVLHSYRSA